MGHVMAGIMWTMAGNTTRAFNDNAQVGNPQTAASETATASGSSAATATDGSVACVTCHTLSAEAGLC